MSKYKLIFTIVLLFSFAVFSVCADSVRTFFPARHGKNIMPVDSEIGRLARLTSTGEHAILSQAMSETFDVDWCEKYLAESVRKPITDLYSDFLSSHLPASSFFISEGKAFGETGRSLAVKFSDGKIAEFAVENKMISVMKTIQRNL